MSTSPAGLPSGVYASNTEAERALPKAAKRQGGKGWMVVVVVIAVVAAAVGAAAAWMSG